MYRICCLIFCCLCVFATASGQAPNTQLYVFDIRTGDTTVALTNPRYLSSFNPRGYNNQPSWSGPDLLYASVKMPDREQTDIYRFDLAGGTRQQLTDTEAGEYSPKPVKGANRFSAVRQEYRTQDTVLRLWDFPTDLSDNGRPLFPSVNGIAYYEWLNNDQLAVLMRQQPMPLVMMSASGATPRTLASAAGRSFTRLTNGDLVYVDKSRSPHQLVAQNLYRLEEAATDIAPMLAGTEDFIVLSDGSYLAGRDHKLYRLQTDQGIGWREVVDLSHYNITRITRLALNNQGQLAVVAEN